MEELLETASSGDNETILPLTTNLGVNFNGLSEGKSDETSLWWAAFFGLKEVAKCLIENGADVNVVEDESKFTPLLVACHRGHSEIVNLLVNSGAVVNASNAERNSLFYLAAWNGHEEVVECLLQNGVDINQFDNESRSTPLSLASAQGHLHVVSLLINKGALVNVSDKDGRTSLWWAAKEGHSEVVECLLQNGADFNQVDNETTLTPLILASAKGHLQVVKLLINKGADVNAGNKFGHTSLWWATEQGRKEVVEYLIQNGADKNVVGGWNKCTPLILASEHGHLDVAILLINSGAEINAGDREGKSSLGWASGEGHKDIVILLLERGAKVNQTNNEGWTALHWAAQKGHRNIVEILLNRGADVHRGTYTPWKIAENNGNPEIKDMILTWNLDLCRGAAANDLHLVQSLLSSGRDINERDGTVKETPLHWAAKNGHIEVVKFLLEKGADYKARNASKKTAWGLAEKNGHSQISAIIKSWASKTPKERRLKGIVTKLQRQLVEVGVNINSSKNAEATLPTLTEEDETNFDPNLQEPKFIPKNSETTVNEPNQSSVLANRRLENILVKLKSNAINLTDDNFKKISDFTNELESLHEHIKGLEKEVEKNKILIQDLLSKIEGLNESQSELDELKLKERNYLSEIEKLKNEIANFRTKKTNVINHYNTFIINNQNVTSTGAQAISPSRGSDWSSLISNVKAKILKKEKKTAGTLSYMSSTTSSISMSKSLLLDIVTNGDEFTLLELLRTGCDINTRFECSHTSLHLACKHNSVEVVKTLLDAKAKIEATNKHRATPLMVASEQGRLDIVQLLLESKANVNATMSNGITALYLAVKKGHTAIVKYLLEKGADANLCSIKKVFPLHRVAQNGNEEIARLLLKNGADVNALNNKNETAADVAQRKLHFQCRNLILNGPIEDGNEEATPSVGQVSSSLEVERVNDSEILKQTVFNSSGNFIINTGTVIGTLKGDVEEINIKN